MTIVGSTQRFLTDIYGDRFVPDLLMLILAAWPQVSIPGGRGTALHEPNISALLADKICDQLWLLAYSGRALPFTCHKEVQQTDPVTGVQYARWDIEFHHTRHQPLGLESYFVIEAKKLRVYNSGKIIPNTGAYMTEMSLFLENEKSASPALCGMIAYVMDGDTVAASADLAKALLKKPSLNIKSTPCFRGCPHVAAPHGETEHDPAVQRSGPLVMYHLFLAV